MGLQDSAGNNIVNGGFVAQQGAWLYFSNPFDGNALYKEKLDGTTRERLAEGYCQDISIAGDRVK